MQLSKTRKQYFQIRSLRKSNNRLKESILNYPALVEMVKPAFVYHVDDIRENVHPSLCRFAKEHQYEYATLLKRLRREQVLTKERGTWVLRDDLKDKGLVFYTVGRTNIYGSLDMFLLPEGVKYMEEFIEAHPIKHRVKRNQESNQE